MKVAKATKDQDSQSCHNSGRRLINKIFRFLSRQVDDLLSPGFSPDGLPLLFEVLALLFRCHRSLTLCFTICLLCLCTQGCTVLGTVKRESGFFYCQRVTSFVYARWWHLEKCARLHFLEEYLFWLQQSVKRLQQASFLWKKWLLLILLASKVVQREVWLRKKMHVANTLTFCGERGFTMFFLMFIDTSTGDY